MNKVILMGRLTRDPEVRYTQTNNTLVASFALAVNRRFARPGEERQADFINIVVFGRQAENVQKYITKGSQIAVDGRIQTGSYEKDGVKRNTFDVIANNVQFLDSKNKGTNDFESNVTPDSFSNEPETSSVKDDPFADFGSSIEINDDELPF